MKKIKLFLFASLSIIALNSCTDEVEAPQTPYATFEMNSFDVGVDEGGQTSKDIKIYTANVTNSDRVFDVAVESSELDAAAYTVPSTVTIPAGTNEGILSVNIQDVGLSLLDQMLEIKLVQSDDIFVGENLKMAVSLNCPGADNKIKIKLGFDSWPEEAAWRILNSNGDTVAASADPLAFGAYGGMTGSTTVPTCLPSGNYTIQIFDQYGDGGTSYSITANGNPIFAISGSGYEGSYSATISF